MVLPSPENGSVTPEAQAAPVPITLTATNATADRRRFFLVGPMRYRSSVDGSNVGARRCRGHRGCPATSPRASPDAVGAFQALLRNLAGWSEPAPVGFQNRA